MGFFDSAKSFVSELREGVKQSFSPVQTVKNTEQLVNDMNLYNSVGVTPKTFAEFYALQNELQKSDPSSSPLSPTLPPPSNLNLAPQSPTPPSRTQELLDEDLKYIQSNTKIENKTFTSDYNNSYTYAVQDSLQVAEALRDSFLHKFTPTINAIVELEKIKENNGGQFENAEQARVYEEATKQRQVQRDFIVHLANNPDATRDMEKAISDWKDKTGMSPTTIDHIGGYANNEDYYSTQLAQEDFKRAFGNLLSRPLKSIFDIGWSGLGVAGGLINTGLQHFGNVIDTAVSGTIDGARAEDYRKNRVSGDSNRLNNLNDMFAKDPNTVKTTIAYVQDVWTDIGGMFLPTPQKVVALLGKVAPVIKALPKFLKAVDTASDVAKAIDKATDITDAAKIANAAIKVPVSKSTYAVNQITKRIVDEVVENTVQNAMINGHSRHEYTDVDLYTDIALGFLPAAVGGWLDVKKYAPLETIRANAEDYAQAVFKLDDIEWSTLDPKERRELADAIVTSTERAWGKVQPEINELMKIRRGVDDVYDRAKKRSGEVINKTLSLLDEKKWGNYIEKIPQKISNGENSITKYEYKLKIDPQTNKPVASFKEFLKMQSDVFRKLNNVKVFAIGNVISDIHKDLVSFDNLKDDHQKWVVRKTLSQMDDGALHLFQVRRGKNGMKKADSYKEFYEQLNKFKYTYQVYKEFGLSVGDVFDDAIDELEYKRDYSPTPQQKVKSVQEKIKSAQENTVQSEAAGGLDKYRTLSINTKKISEGDYYAFQKTDKRFEDYIKFRRLGEHQIKVQIGYMNWLREMFNIKVAENKFYWTMLEVHNTPNRPFRGELRTGSQFPNLLEFFYTVGSSGKIKIGDADPASYKVTYHNIENGKYITHITVEGRVDPIIIEDLKYIGNDTIEFVKSDRLILIPGEKFKAVHYLNAKPIIETIISKFKTSHIKDPFVINMKYFGGGDIAYLTHVKESSAPLKKGTETNIPEHKIIRENFLSYINSFDEVKESIKDAVKRVEYGTIVFKGDHPGFKDFLKANGSISGPNGSFSLDGEGNIVSVDYKGKPVDLGSPPEYHIEDIRDQERPVTPHVNLEERELIYDFAKRKSQTNEITNLLDDHGYGDYLFLAKDGNVQKRVDLIVEALSVLRTGNSAFPSRYSNSYAALAFFRHNTNINLGTTKNLELPDGMTDSILDSYLAHFDENPLLPMMYSMSSNIQDMKWLFAQSFAQHKPIKKVHMTDAEYKNKLEIQGYTKFNQAVEFFKKHDFDDDFVEALEEISSWIEDPKKIPEIYKISVAPSFKNSSLKYQDKSELIIPKEKIDEPTSQSLDNVKQEQVDIDSDPANINPASEEKKRDIKRAKESIDTRTSAGDVESNPNFSGLLGGNQYNTVKWKTFLPKLLEGETAISPHERFIEFFMPGHTVKLDKHHNTNTYYLDGPLTQGKSIKEKSDAYSALIQEIKRFLYRNDGSFGDVPGNARMRGVDSQGKKEGRHYAMLINGNNLVNDNAKEVVNEINKAVHSGQRFIINLPKDTPTNIIDQFEYLQKNTEVVDSGYSKDLLHTFLEKTRTNFNGMSDENIIEKVLNEHMEMWRGSAGGKYKQITTTKQYTPGKVHLIPIELPDSLRNILGLEGQLYVTKVFEEAHHFDKKRVDKDGVEHDRSVFSIGDDNKPTLNVDNLTRKRHLGNEIIDKSINNTKEYC